MRRLLLKWMPHLIMLLLFSQLTRRTHFFKKEEVKIYSKRILSLNREMILTTWLKTMMTQSYWCLLKMMIIAEGHSCPEFIIICRSTRMIRSKKFYAGGRPTRKVTQAALSAHNLISTVCMSSSLWKFYKTKGSKASMSLAKEQI